MYTTKEAAAILGITEQTLCSYADQDLIPDLKQDKNKHWFFDQQAIEWLTGINYLEECGMSMESIKKYVDLWREGDSTIEKRYEILLKQKELARLQVEKAKERFEYLEQKSAHYEKIVTASKEEDFKFKLKQEKYT